MARRKIDTQNFIANAKSVHGNRYDYSQSEYINSSTKIKIICKRHGIFEQLPRKHINQKHNCPACGNQSRQKNNASTNEEFTAKAKIIHGGYYSYKNVDYRNNNIEIEITCPKHGDFSQTPSAHLKLNIPCKSCRNETTNLITNIKKTNYDFIRDAIKTHGSKYSYNKVRYVNNRTAVTIICKDHGDFQQVPYSHINGAGCPYCFNVKRSNKSKAYCKSELIQTFNIVHSYAYLYPDIDPKSATSNIEVVCPQHGSFYPVLKEHARGLGVCPDCSESAPTTTADFINKSNSIHLKRYDYSKVDYIDRKSKVAIICRTHGEFRQVPYAHMAGQGCPACSKIRSSGELAIESYLNQSPLVDTFEIEKTMKGMTDKRNLRFDFYIEQYNLAIEYDGQQHFNPHAYYSGASEEEKQANLTEVQRRDSIKDQWCFDNNIRLIRIAYYDTDNIPNVLEEALMQFQNDLVY